MQAIGEEGDKDVRLDPLFILVEDRTMARSPLRFLKASSTAAMHAWPGFVPRLGEQVLLQAAQAACTQSGRWSRE